MADGLSEDAGGDIPEANGAIATAARERQPIRTEMHVGNRLGVSSESLARFAGSDIPDSGDIPEANGAIVTAARKCQPIRTETDTIDLFDVSGEGFQVCAGGGIPEANGVVRTSTCER